MLSWSAYAILVLSRHFEDILLHRHQLGSFESRLLDGGRQFLPLFLICGSHLYNVVGDR